MHVFKDLSQIPEQATGNVIVIGNFDGVHRGHVALLERARQKADALGCGLGILTFEPHPKSLFRSGTQPFRITPFALKQERLSLCEIDHLFALDFNWDLASLSADEFIQNILKAHLQPKHIIVGDDFRFGQMRKGTPQSLIDAGLSVDVITKIANEQNQIFSSSLIREALRHGDITAANEALGWEWEMRGIIVKGDQRGRELGYPTANVPLEDTLHPAYGIYATRVQIMEDGLDSPWLMAATNIGIRPMFELKVGQVEAHILDFDRDIYGCTLRVRPVEKIRGEAKFDSLEALIAQMEKDCRKARAILDSASTT